MLRHFVVFEVRYRLRQTSTWVYFGVYFALTLLLASVPHFGGGGGKVMTNSPYALARIYVLMTSIGTLILSALFGTTVLRDYQEHMDQIIFTKPIRQSDYLGGRLLGTVLVACLVKLIDRNPSDNITEVTAREGKALAGL
jgi:hypothetical protein